MWPERSKQAAGDHAVPIHIVPAGPCEDFGFYSEMVSIGSLWTAEWLNSYSNIVSLAAVHWKGVGQSRRSVRRLLL